MTMGPHLGLRKTHPRPGERRSYEHGLRTPKPSSPRGREANSHEVMAAIYSEDCIWLESWERKKDALTKYWSLWFHRIVLWLYKKNKEKSVMGERDGRKQNHQGSHFYLLYLWLWPFLTIIGSIYWLPLCARHRLIHFTYIDSLHLY